MIRIISLNSFQDIFDDICETGPHDSILVHFIMVNIVINLPDLCVCEVKESSLARKRS